MNGARKPNDYQQLNGSYAHILIGPLEGTEHGLTDDPGRKVKAHYRRGFVKADQRYGPGRSLTRPVSILPVLVNAKTILAGQALPAKKTYSVK